MVRDEIFGSIDRIFHPTYLTSAEMEALGAEPTEAKPYPNEHACRLNEPGKYSEFGRVTRKYDGKEYSVIRGHLKGKDEWEDQAFRYKKDVWEVAAARAHCKAHDGSFEAASGEGAGVFEPCARLENIERMVRKSDAALSALIGRAPHGAMVDALIERGAFDAALEIKGLSEDDRIIEGYANTKHLDRMNDVIDPKAFEDSLDYFLQHGVILYGHNPWEPIGRPLDGKINSKGFLLKAQIAKGLGPDDIVEKSWNLIRQRVLRAFSVGFRILPNGIELSGEDGDEHRARIIKALELYEVSVVTVPANRESIFSLAKSVAVPNSHNVYAFGAWPRLDERESVAPPTPHNLKPSAYANVEQTMRTMNDMIDESETADYVSRVERAASDLSKLKST